MKKIVFILLSSLWLPALLFAQTTAHLSQPSSGQSVFLRSALGYHGNYSWQMMAFKDVAATGEEVSSTTYQTDNWKPAIVPGTVLNSLVANKVYPEPYYGDNNRKSRKLIPDIEDVGREFYHYWFRTAFNVPASFKGKHIWVKLHGINYRSNIWVNGKNIGHIDGMFNAQSFDITAIANTNGKNVLAVDVQPVDIPGSYYKPGKTQTGAVGENHNGGDGEIGRNVTMLMSVGWDFTSPDGIRDRNTGIWRDVELYATGDVTLANAFVQTRLPLPDTASSKETISVEVKNATGKPQTGTLTAIIDEAGVKVSQIVKLEPNETKTVAFLPEKYSELNIKHPKLWWPINKGAQHLYKLSLSFITPTKQVSQTLTTRFGVREITSDQHTPDSSRRFLVNGHPVFIRGTNWVPEAMLRNTEERTLAELRYTKQAGVNFLRLWGGGIAESDYFYELCDEYGFLIWNEFWVTADTKLPADTALYFKNFTSTIKRIRNHASMAYYVDANEGHEVPGTGKLVAKLDPSHGYQEESECCGVHDGSPYKYENPMQYFENTASPRGSRVDGFNPEYGTPILPTLSSLKKMMPQRDLWPITDSIWNYLDGNGFHGITTKYKKAVDQFGASSSIAEFDQKAQLVGAMNYRAIAEVWDYNKFGLGDRFASGYLFWYHNSPLPQTASRIYDWYLTPTAALYYYSNGLSPLHPQFDYLKNTVSIYNDYRVKFDGYTLEATLYDLDSKQVWQKSVTVDIPADGLVKDAFKIDFPDKITQVHFIKLNLKDKAGKIVADAFYWRSKDQYKGAWTLTGPAVSGFEDLSKLPATQVWARCKWQQSNNSEKVKVQVQNTGKHLVFFTQIRLVDGEDEDISPAYFSDNFFSLLPGEKKEITIQVDKKYVAKKSLRLLLNGWNVKQQIIKN